MTISIINMGYTSTGLSELVSSDQDRIFHDVCHEINPMLDMALAEGKLSAENIQQLSNIITRCNNALSGSEINCPSERVCYQSAIRHLSRRIEAILNTKNDRQSLTAFLKAYELVRYESPQVSGETTILHRYKNLELYLFAEEQLGCSLEDYCAYPSYIKITIEESQLTMIRDILDQYQSQSWQAFFWNTICCGVFGEHYSQTLRALKELVKPAPDEVGVTEDKIKQTLFASEPRYGWHRLSLFCAPNRADVHSGTDEIICELAEKVFARGV